MTSTFSRIVRKFGFALALASCHQVPAHSTSLCEAHEKPVFSCELKNSKIVSICTAPDGAPSYIEYRFGKPAKIEMTHRVIRPDQAFQRADFIYGNNAVDTIWFRNGEHLYDVTMPARGAPAVEVWKNRKILAHIECKDGWKNVEGDTDLKSPLIIDHGEVDVSNRDKLWYEKQ
jgi:hypothetical protein